MLIHIQDHFDSFTYNIAQYFSRLGKVKVYPYKNYLDPNKINKTDFLILGPGPGTPNDYPNLLSFLKNFKGENKLLGICLGHQAMGVSLGGTLYKSSPAFGQIEPLFIHKKSQHIVFVAIMLGP